MSVLTISKNDESDFAYFQYVIFSLSILSLITMILLALCFGLIKPLRRFPNNMILFDSIADIIITLNTSISLLLPNEEPNWICKVQAFISQFFGLASIGWNFVISINLFLMLRNPFAKTQKYSKWYHLYVWGTAALGSVALFVQPNNIVPTDSQFSCWFKQSRSYIAFTFFLPLLLYIFVCLFVLLYAISKLSRGLPDSTVARYYFILQELFYIGFFAAFWTLPVIERIVLFIGNRDNALFQWLGAIGIVAQSLGNISVFATNPALIRTLVLIYRSVIAFLLRYRLLPTSLHAHLNALGNLAMFAYRKSDPSPQHRSVSVQRIGLSYSPSDLGHNTTRAPLLDYDFAEHHSPQDHSSVEGLRNGRMGLKFKSKRRNKKQFSNNTEVLFQSQRNGLKFKHKHDSNNTAILSSSQISSGSLAFSESHPSYSKLSPIKHSGSQHFNNQNEEADDADSLSSCSVESDIDDTQAMEMQMETMMTQPLVSGGAEQVEDHHGEDLFEYFIDPTKIDQALRKEMMTCIMLGVRHQSELSAKEVDMELSRYSVSNSALRNENFIDVFLPESEFERQEKATLQSVIKHLQRSLWSRDNMRTSVSETTFEIIDYAPRAFEVMRRLHGISLSSLKYSFNVNQVLDNFMKENFSEGKSGSFFCRTHDNRYIVKTVSEEEMNLLHKILSKYIRYHAHHPETLLPPIFGCFQIKLFNTVIIRFVIMRNVFDALQTIHQRYDLKGSWVSRSNPSFARRPEAALGLDNDRHMMFVVGTKIRKRLEEQLQRDSDLLASLEIIDYSLLVGVHFQECYAPDEGITIKNKSQKSNATVMLTSRRRKDHGASSESIQNVPFYRQHNGGIKSIPESDGDPGEIYYMGIIDILQEYNFSKKMERFLKTVFLCKDKNGISAAPPALYATRFQERVAMHCFE